MRRLVLTLWLVAALVAPAVASAQEATPVLPPTGTPASLATGTATSLPTESPVPPPTGTPVPASTATPVPTPTETPAPVETLTATAEPTSTATSTATPTSTPTPRPSATPVPAGQLVLAPIADARVAEAHPSTNYGASTLLAADGDPGSTDQSFLKFTVQGFGSVGQATLRLYIGTNGTVDGPAVSLAGNDWSENTITFANRPPIIAGPGFDAGPLKSGAWATFDVTNLIGGDGTYTLELMSTSHDGVDFNSKEASSNWPQLVLLPGSGVPTLTPELPDPVATGTAIPATATGTSTPLPAETSTATSSPTVAATADSTSTPDVTPSPTATGTGGPTATVVACTPQYLVLVPAADAFVSQAAPVTNYGTGAELRAKLSATAQTESYLRFNVPSLPGGISKAVLAVVSAAYTGAGTASAPDVWLADSGWTETGVTWAGKPALGGLVAPGGGAWPMSAVYQWNVSGVVTGGGSVTLALIPTSGDGVNANSREQTSAPPTLTIGYGCGAGGGVTPTAVATSTATSTPEGTGTPTPSVTPTGTATATPAASATATPEAGVVLVAAGDIACAAGTAATTIRCQQQATSDVALAAHPDAVLALGDLQYECGTAADFAASYDPSWGRLKAITHPAIGNHEYNIGGGVSAACSGMAAPSDAGGYFGYFGAAAGNPAQGYYSFDIGAWHVLVINAMLCGPVFGGSHCYQGSAQERWVANDLASHPNACTLAAWHEPLISTSEREPGMGAIWNDLYVYGVDVVLNGHLHRYERWQPLGPVAVGTTNAAPDPVYGIREFIAGTGGRSLQALGSNVSGLETGNDVTFGVLKLTLRANDYDWHFLPAAGGAFTDSGSASCHGAPGSAVISNPAVAVAVGRDLSPRSIVPVALAWVLPANLEPPVTRRRRSARNRRLPRSGVARTPAGARSGRHRWFARR